MNRDIEVVISNAITISRTPKGSGDLRVIWETHWGLRPVQEHGEETSIYDVEVVKSDAMKESKNTERIW